MFEKFKKMFEIHVVEECGINGSLLALMLDCTSHVTNAGNRCPIPGSHIKDVFFIPLHRQRCGWISGKPSRRTHR
jgi:hypothetical protein